MGNRRVPDGDGVERLKVVYKPEGLTVLLEHTEPAGLVSCGGWLIYSGGDAILDDLYCLIPGGRRDGNITKDSGCMRYRWNLDRWEVLVIEAATLGRDPSEGSFVVEHHPPD